MSGAKSFVWCELLTSDLHAAKAFYGKVLGWDMHDMAMPAGTYTVLNAAGTGIGGIMEMPKDVTGMGPFWSPYIEMDDVDAGTKQAHLLGAKILRPAQDIPNVGRFAPIADPQGAIINLFKSLRPGAVPEAGATGTVGWYELHAKNWEDELTFYSKMFGWTQGEGHDIGPMGIYQIFNIGAQAAGGMFSSPEPAKGCFWLPYFRAGDIDAAQRRLGEAGGKTLNGPMQVPGGDWVVQAMDPQGAKFALMGRRAA
jgi:predicted enzyme related to lactoylglutathione lyase